jgi:hypothetical protein
VEGKTTTSRGRQRVRDELSNFLQSLAAYFDLLRHRRRRRWRAQERSESWRDLSKECACAHTRKKLARTPNLHVYPCVQYIQQTHSFLPLIRLIFRPCCPTFLSPPPPPPLALSLARSLSRSLARSLSLSFSLCLCVCVCVCPLPVSNPTYLQDHEHKAPFALDAFVATASVLPGDPRSFPLKNLALSSRAGAPTRVCKHSTHTTAHTSAHTCMYTHMNTYTTQCMHARV